MTKGQLISKGLFGFFNSSKKRTKNFCPSRLGQKLKFSSSFFGRIEDIKIYFRDYLTFSIFACHAMLQGKNNQMRRQLCLETDCFKRVRVLFEDIDILINLFGFCWDSAEILLRFCWDSAEILLRFWNSSEILLRFYCFKKTDI